MDKWRWVFLGVIVLAVLGGAIFLSREEKKEDVQPVKSSVVSEAWSPKINPETNLPDYPTKTATIQGEKYTILTTRTVQENRLGLGAVADLPDNYGMSFFGSGKIGIWMKGMKYSIDIIWLDKDGRVIHIVHDAQPSSYPKTTFANPAGTDAHLVIELNTGEAKRLGLENGMKITLE